MSENELAQKKAKTKCKLADKLKAKNRKPATSFVGAVGVLQPDRVVQRVDVQVASPTYSPTTPASDDECELALQRLPARLVGHVGASTTACTPCRNVMCIANAQVNIISLGYMQMDGKFKLVCSDDQRTAWLSKPGTSLRFDIQHLSPAGEACGWSNGECGAHEDCRLEEYDGAAASALRPFEHDCCEGDGKQTESWGKD
ncbi:unnamed protein product [Phytophthora fragariaefolia]|uniref:Unnamed protein product n=1 Tax=Phytophthora fragariaefolia TaxID=1490495 RepID=A0A9W6XJZ7_9STRA|nr:unnamed protein product [Phytophthora fragariaefolia]